MFEVVLDCPCRLPARYFVLKMTTMQEPGKILVASQYYVPDPSTTAVYMAAIAEGLAVDNQVVVLSGSPNSMANPGADQKTPTVIEIQNWTPQKDALVRRAIAISLLASRVFLATLMRARRNRHRLLCHHTLHAALCCSIRGKAARRRDCVADL